MLDEWHDLVDYTVAFIAPYSLSYRATWYKLFHLCIESNRWENILLLIRLLFCLPVSNAIVERFFGSLKRVKNLGERAALGQKTTEDILTIMTKEPPHKEYDATSAVLSWYSSKSRRLNQKERKSDKKRESGQPKIYEPLSDSESEQELAELDENTNFFSE